MATLSLENYYNKPTNKVWKFASKFLTRTLPIYAGIIAVIPNESLSIEIKLWVNVALSAMIATISAISEFTAEAEPMEQKEIEANKESVKNIKDEISKLPTGKSKKDPA